MAEAVSGFAAGEEEAVTRFGEALDTLKKRLRRRIAVTAFFQAALDVSASLPDRFDLLLQAAKTDNASCLDGELEFFRQVIRRYLR